MMSTKIGIRNYELRNELPQTSDCGRSNLLLIKAKSNCDVCEFSSFTSSVSPETLNELLLQWDFNQPMATKVVAFFYCIMSCTIGTELSF